jgi:hypothetical protein
MIKIIDNFIPLSYQQEIKSLLLSNKFPWFYVDDVTSDTTLPEDRCPALCNPLRIKYNTNSNFYNYFIPLAHIGAAAVDYKFNDVSMCRTFLQFPLSKTKPVDPLHTDDSINHLVVLYYVLDSDGDTIIVDKKMDLETKPLDNLRVEDFLVLKKVTPKQGRAVLFDGRYYHTAEQPKNGIRCVINFNIV